MTVLNLKLIERFLKEEIKNRVDSSKKAPPATFNEFLCSLGRVLEELSAPEEFVNSFNLHVSDAAHVVSEMHKFWKLYQNDQRSNKVLSEGVNNVGFWALYECEIHSTLLSALKVYEDKMNYEPGVKPTPVVDGGILISNAVAKLIDQ